MCCAILNTWRSYLRTNSSYAETSPFLTLSTRAISGCCSFSPANGWMVAMGVGCGNLHGARNGAPLHTSKCNGQHTLRQMRISARRDGRSRNRKKCNGDGSLLFIQDEIGLTLRI